MACGKRFLLLLGVLLGGTCRGSRIGTSHELRRTLFFEAIYDVASMSMSMSMSMPSYHTMEPTFHQSSKGKGKGKGLSKKKSKGKSKKKGPKSKKKVKDSKKSPKSKGGKNKGKGKGKGQGFETSSPTGPFKSPQPTTSPASQPPNSSQPSNAQSQQGQPTLSPIGQPTSTTPPNGGSPTASPTQAPMSDITLQIAPYSLFFTIDQTRIPSTSDYSGLTTATEAYLEEYFRNIFGNTADISFTGSSTVLLSNDFRLGMPVQVDFNTTITVAGDSTIIPAESDLNALLASAFLGQNNAEYLAAIQQLAATNIFSTTSEISFVPNAQTASDGSSSSTNSSPPSSSNQGNSNTGRTYGIAAAVGVGAVAILTAGLLLVQQRHTEDGVSHKYLKEGDGQITVAGDTYMAGSCDSQSELHRVTRSACMETDSECSDYQETELRRPRPTSPAATLEDVQETDSECGDSELGTSRLRDVSL